MKRAVITILLFCFLVPYSEAQVWKRRRFELIGGIGFSQFFGDIGGFSQGSNYLGFKDLSFSGTRFNVGAGLRYRITQKFSTRFSLTYGSFHSSDTKGSNETRDLESTTLFLEPALVAEYYFAKHINERSFLLSKRGQGNFWDVLKALDFYVFSGIGANYYKVKPNQNLQDRGVDPNGVAPVIPLGIGGTLIYSPTINFGFELGGRYSFTDNLDGYSSQYSRSNDVYYFLNFTMSYKFKTGLKKMSAYR